MDIRRREILRAFSVSEDKLVIFLNKINLNKEDSELINFIEIINNETYKSQKITEIINSKK